MVELVDMHALGACAERRNGSSPFIPTKRWLQQYNWITFIRKYKLEAQYLKSS